MRNKSNVRDISVANFGNKINKRGILGDVIMLFVATVAIFLLLLFLILGSGVVKKTSKNEGAFAVYSETGSEIDNIFDYMGRYEGLTKIKFFMERDSSLDESTQEAGYEE